MKSFFFAIEKLTCAPDVDACWLKACKNLKTNVKLIIDLKKQT